MAGSNSAPNLFLARFKFPSALIEGIVTKRIMCYFATIDYHKMLVMLRWNRSAKHSVGQDTVHSSVWLVTMKRIDYPFYDQFRKMMFYTMRDEKLGYPLPCGLLKSGTVRPTIAQPAKLLLRPTISHDEHHKLVSFSKPEVDTCEICGDLKYDNNYVAMMPPKKREQYLCMAVDALPRQS